MLCIIVVVLFVAFNFSYFSMLFQSIDKKGTIQGEIFMRKELPTTTQTVTGNRTRNNFILYKYRYKVNGKEYQDSARLSYSIINSTQLRKIQMSVLPVKISVKYDNKNPSESVIWMPRYL